MGPYEGSKPDKCTGEEIGSNAARINNESDGFGPSLGPESDVTSLGADKGMNRSGVVRKREGEGGLLLGNGVHWSLFVLTLILHGNF